ncbi:MAG: response regulator [Gammaproteobacteria bacterium]
MAVVDDEASVRKAMSRLIRSAGMAVETYASGTEFLASLGDHQPGCVVLDLHMPRLDGFDVYEQLAGSGLGIPVILITGHDTPETRARSTAVGMTAYFRKPVDDQALLDAIVCCTRPGASA